MDDDDDDDGDALRLYGYQIDINVVIERVISSASWAVSDVERGRR